MLFSRQADERDTLLELSPKEVAVDLTKMANRRDFLGQAQSPSPLSSLLVPGSTAVVTSHLSKRVRTALHGRLPTAISKGLRPSHRRDVLSRFLLVAHSHSCELETLG